MSQKGRTYNGGVDRQSMIINSNGAAPADKESPGVLTPTRKDNYTGLGRRADERGANTAPRSRLAVNQRRPPRP
jgi:hypothetical protein